MTEHVATIEHDAFDALLTDLQPKPCPECEGDAPKWAAERSGLCFGDCLQTGTVPGVAVIPLDQQPTFTHRCPLGDSGVMPCCGRTPFEAPNRDRIATDDALVTCGRSLTIREAADASHCPWVTEWPPGICNCEPPREVVVRVIGWADGQLTIERE